VNSRYRVATLVLIVGAVLACVPVIYSLHQARKQAISDKYVLLDDVARYLQQQIHTSVAMLAQLRQEMQHSGDPPCSPAGIARLQRFSLTAPVVKGTLYVQDNRVLCSSNGALMQGMQLGPATMDGPTGINIRSGLQVPGVEGRQFLLLEQDGLGVVVDPVAMLVPFQRPDLALGSFNSRTGVYTARYGNALDSWIAPGTTDDSLSHFIDTQNGYLVARRVIRHNGVGVIVATPLSAIDKRTAKFVHWFIPIGVLAGALVLGIAWLLTRRHVSARAELLDAINKGHLFLLYQPVFDLQDGTCIGAESLLRWRHEDGTVVPPDLFIPFAEDAGLIQLLSRRVMELVQQDMKGLLRQHPRFRIGINLSPRDLQSAQTPLLLTAMQRAIGTGYGRFVVEATERGLLEEASALDVVNAIRALGIEIAIDDFGTGYSSLAYLATYPFDILKVDKSFTSTACTEAVTSQVATHIIDLACSLGMQTLVEGIETEEQATFFRNKGVVYGQGYYFGRPMPASELADFLPLHCRPGQHAAPLTEVEHVAPLQPRPS